MGERKASKAREIDLSTIKTSELVPELSMLEGVEKHIAEPYTDKSVSVNGLFLYPQKEMEMEIGNKRAENVIGTNADGEVLAVISDAEIVEKKWYMRDDRGRLI